MEVMSFISFFLGAAWDFFTEIKVPGFDFSFAAFFVGLFLASFGLRILFSMVGMSVNAESFTGFLRSKDKFEKRE